MILDHIKNSAESAGASFYFATPDKANVMMDEVLAFQFPVIIVLPYRVTDTVNENTGAIESEIDLDFYALQRREDATMDFSHYDVEGEITEPMRALARKFLHILNETDMVSATNKSITSKTPLDRADDVLDSHLFGVKGACVVPLIESASACA